ncbi:hypothetical protein M5689_022433 [Euphorbia peplus]|nr:hypothetical protein M5689_022433 [Euphorbia peplus]
METSTVAKRGKFPACLENQGESIVIRRPSKTEHFAKEREGIVNKAMADKGIPPEDGGWGRSESLEDGERMGSGI